MFPLYSTIITRWLSCMRRIEELFKQDVHLARVLLLFGGFGLISMASHNFVGLSYVIAKLSSICFISSSKCLSFFCLDNLINSSSQIFEFSPFRPGILLYKLSVCLIFLSRVLWHLSSNGRRRVGIHLQPTLSLVFLIPRFRSYQVLSIGFLVKFRRIEPNCFPVFQPQIFEMG